LDAVTSGEKDGRTDMKQTGGFGG